MTHIILTTSNIYRIEPDDNYLHVCTPREGEEVKDRVNNEYVIVSTGKLERALKRPGDEVWVVSSRLGSGPHDTWWMKLIPGDHVIFNSGRDDLYQARKWVEMLPDFDPLNSHHRDALHIMILYSRLGLSYPRREDGEPEFWYSALNALHDNHDVLMGRDI